MHRAGAADRLGRDPQRRRRREGARARRRRGLDRHRRADRDGRQQPRVRGGVPARSAARPASTTTGRRAATRSGISTQDDELAARFDPVLGGRRVANYLRVLTLETQTLARACGKSHVHNLEPEDLVALTVEAAAMARVPLAGTTGSPAATAVSDGREGRVEPGPYELEVGGLMLLYDSAVSGNCYKVRLLLAHLGMPYERREVDVADRSGRKELLGDLNPALRVPTVVFEDGRALGESGAILWYLADGTQYVPAESWERAKVLQWMFFEQYSHEPNVAVARFWLHTLGAAPSEEALAGEAAARLPGARRGGARPRRPRVPRRRPLLDRGHRALRVHARRRRGRLRPRSLSGDPRLDRPRRRATAGTSPSTRNASCSTRMCATRAGRSPAPTGALPGFVGAGL